MYLRKKKLLTVNWACVCKSNFHFLHCHAHQAAAVRRRNSELMRRRRVQRDTRDNAAAHIAGAMRFHRNIAMVWNFQCWTTQLGWLPSFTEWNGSHTVSAQNTCPRYRLDVPKSLTSKKKCGVVMPIIMAHTLQVFSVHAFEKKKKRKAQRQVHLQATVMQTSWSAKFTEAKGSRSQANNLTRLYSD